MNLPEFSVRHSVFGNMLTIFVLFAGIVLLTLLQRDTFPEIELDLVVITTAYPNASPHEVEDLVTNRIEEELKEVEDIEEYSSSSVEGLSVVTVQIDPDARYKERVINEVQRKVDQVDGLPDESENPDVVAISARGPMIRICIYGDVDESVLRTYGDYLKNRLETIAGVSGVEKSGWRDEEFWVEVDLPEIERQEIPLSAVVDALKRRNVNLPGGKIPEGSKELILRTLGQFYTADEIQEVIIRANTDGNHVRIKDIATVERTYEEDSIFSRVNGTRAVVLGVKKKLSGDTITVATQIKDIIAEESSITPEGVSVTYVDDESYYVERRLEVLKSNGIIGFVLVVIVLFLFLNFRVALITGIGIPFAFLGALMIMSLFGITVNLITMFGLIIVLGMVVDDAIIVGENIFRHIEEGMHPRDAAIQGTGEVMYPVISTVLTTMAAFLPLIFAPGTIGQVLKWFPVVVSITLLASLIEVLLVLPCHVADFVPMGSVKTSKEGKPQGHRIMHAIQEGYASLLRWCLKFKWLFLLLVFLFFSSLMVLCVKMVEVSIFPSDLIDVFTVKVTGERGDRLEVTEEKMSFVEEKVRALPDSEFENIVTYVGGHLSPEGGFSSRGTHYASALVYLTPQNTRKRKTVNIIDELRDVCKGIEGIDRLEFEMLEPGPPKGKPLEVKIRGDRFETLNEIAAGIMSYLEAYGGVEDLRTSYEEGKEELHIRIDHDEAARLGLSMDRISQAVFAAYQGAESTVIREGDEEVKVRVKLSEPYRNGDESLHRILVKNNTGRMIPLGRVVTLSRTSGLPSVFHYDGSRVVTVSASFKEGVSSTSVNRALEKELVNLPRNYPGYSIIRGGEWKETSELMAFMIKAFGVALLLIYVILTVQFNSGLQPFVVMISIPLGLIGVVVALIAHDKPISIMATMGMVGMAGVVVNDAIVLVKFINDLRREENIEVYEAVLLGGQKRLRPILLTSITTVVGLLPVIYGWGGYEPFVAPAAITLAYGLLFATFLTLLVVPSVYLAFAQIKQTVRGFWGHEPGNVK